MAHGDGPMTKILPKRKWSKDDLKKLKRLKVFKLTPNEAYHISWAIFERVNWIRDELKRMRCRKCWCENYHHKDKDYPRLLRSYREDLKQMDRINTFFHPYHNELGEDYSHTCR